MRSLFFTFSRKSELLGGSFFSKTALFFRVFLGPQKLAYYWRSFFGMGDFHAIYDDFVTFACRKQHHWYLSVGLDRSNLLNFRPLRLLCFLYNCTGKRSRIEKLWKGRGFSPTFLQFAHVI